MMHTTVELCFRLSYLQCGELIGLVAFEALVDGSHSVRSFLPKVKQGSLERKALKLFMF